MEDFGMTIIILFFHVSDSAQKLGPIYKKNNQNKKNLKSHEKFIYEVVIRKQTNSVGPYVGIKYFSSSQKYLSTHTKTTETNNKEPTRNIRKRGPEPNNNKHQPVTNRSDGSNEGPSLPIIPSATQTK